MPSGDAQRVWFPEMLEELQRTWSASMTWGELAAFCWRMTEKRRAIREARGIRPPRTRCPRCGLVSRSDISGVSVRSALFALRKALLVSDGELRVLDRSWKKYRAANQLDAHGRKVAANEGQHDCC